MTRRISLVAVCCSRASVRSAFLACSSPSRRAFSSAITAWSANVWSSAISAGANPPSRRPGDRDHPDHVLAAQHRHRDDRAEAARRASSRNLGPQEGSRPRRRCAARSGSAPSGLRASPRSEGAATPRCRHEGLAAPGQAAPRRGQADEPVLVAEHRDRPGSEAGACRCPRWPRRPAGRPRARRDHPEDLARWRSGARARRSAPVRTGRSSPAPRRARPAGPRRAPRAQSDRVMPSPDLEERRLKPGHSSTAMRAPCSRAPPPRARRAAAPRPRGP